MIKNIYNNYLKNTTCQNKSLAQNNTRAHFTSAAGNTALHADPLSRNRLKFINFKFFFIILIYVQITKYYFYYIINLIVTSLYTSLINNPIYDLFNKFSYLLSFKDSSADDGSFNDFKLYMKNIKSNWISVIVEDKSKDVRIEEEVSLKELTEEFSKAVNKLLFLSN